MGRNKNLNKIRKRNNEERNGHTSRSSSRATAGSTSTSARRGERDSTEGTRKERGPLRKLLALFGAYPFVIITLAFGLPRLFPMCMRWLRLRSGILGPVVQVHEEKQVLILGALGSGTSQMSAALKGLGVEVGYDTSDSLNSYCRDGTVSWVHGIRYLSGIPNLSALCSISRRPAYSSTMFQPSSECTFIRSLDSECWAQECREVTAREYGCAVREQALAAERRTVKGAESDNSDRQEQSAAAAAAAVVAAPAAVGVGGTLFDKTDKIQPGERRRNQGRRRDQWDIENLAEGEWRQESEEEEAARARGEEEADEADEHSQCGTRFRRSLLQVRHPLRQVTLLTNKSATDKESVGRDCSAGRQQIKVAMAFFTNKSVRTQLGGDGGSGALSQFDWARVSRSCVQTWAWYWVVYNRAMLRGVDGWYRVEDTPPSKVAALAGFSSPAIQEALQSAEQEPPSPEDGEHGALDIGNAMEPTGFEVTWDDIAKFPGGLLREMSDLAVELGYEGAPGLLPTEREEPSGGGSTKDGEVEKGWKRFFGFRRKKKG